MNKKGTKVLASATVVGLVLSTVATGNVKAAPGDVTRVGGADLYETASKVAKANWKDGAENVVLVSGEGYADSLSASVLATKLNAPIILTSSKNLDKNAKDALTSLKPKNVYVVGGNYVISKEVRNEVKGLGLNIEKELYGNTQFDTNLAIANYLVDDLKVDSSEVLVVNGKDGYADALSVAPVAASKGQVLLIVSKNPADAEGAAKFVKAHNSKVTVVGTKNIVPTAVLEKLGAKEENRVNGGLTQFDTNLNVMKHFGLKYDKVYVADASDTKKGYADALVASAIAGRTGSALILTDRGNSKYTQNAINHIKENKNDKTEVEALGGNAVMPEEVVNGIKDAVKADSAELAAAKKAVKAYEDAKITNLEEINVAKALGVEANKAVEAVKDQAQREALEAKIAAKDKLVAEAEAKLAFKIESVTAINETAVQIKGIAKEVKEADLKDKKIELKAGDVTLTAKYVASSLTEDGKANFVLENNKKLVDATEYTVESDWAEFVVNKFVAKVANPYVKTINVTTKAIQGMANNKVYFETKNQYGEDIAVKGNIEAVKAIATINGVPVKEVDEVTINKNDGYVVITNELKEGDKVAINFTNKIGDKDVQVGTASFTAVKKADSVATTISDMKAEYDVEANGHKLNEEAKEVLPDDQVKLSAKILDQFGNPMPEETKARWVAEKGEDLITVTTADYKDGIVDSKDFTFKATKAGDLKVSAYLANGEKVTYEVKIGAKKLTEVKVEGEKIEGQPQINIADVKGNNHEEKIVGVVTPNSGAILTPDMIKFDIKATKTSEEVKPSDVEVVAKLRGKNDEKKNENDIVIAVKSSKVGKYVITPYVGESVEKGIKGNIIAVTTDINKEVASIDDISFDAAELKTGSEIKKDIVFRNKHKEVVVVDAADVIVTPDGMSKKEVGIESIKDTDKKKNVLTLKADQAKTYNVVVKNKDVIRAFNLVFKAPAFTAVELGNDINGVVKGDLDTKAKYQEIKFLDQDGKVMSVKNEDIKVDVTKPDGQPLAESDISNLITLGKTYTVDKDGKVTFEKAEAIDAVVAMKVLPKNVDAIKAGTYTVKISDKDGKISDTLNITVGSKRVAKTVEVKPEATKVVLGGKVKVNIVPKDQYGDFIANAAGIEMDVNAGEHFKKDDVVAIDKDGKVTAKAEDIVAYEVTLTGNTKGTNDVVVNVKEGEKVLATNKVSMTVDSAAGLIDSVAVDTKDIKALYSTKDGAANVNLKAIVKAADGTIIPVSDSDLDWKVVSQKDAEGKEVSTRTVKVDSKAGIVTADQNTVGSAVVEVTTANMKKATITLKFDDKGSVAQKGTVEVINTVKAEDGKTLLPLDADDKKEGIQISLDNDEKDGEKDGAVKVVLNAKDQYGDLLEANKTEADGITLRVDDSSVVKAEKDANGVITITAKGEGDSKVYVEYAGQTITLDVTANKEAVEKAKAAAAEQEAVKAVETFKTNNEAVLKLTADTVKIENKAAVESAITEYDKLSDAAKSQLTAQKALLDNLKTQITKLETEKTAAIEVANQKIADIPAASSIDASNKDDAQAKVTEAEKAVTAAKDKGAQDSDFTDFGKIQEAKDKIATL
ncbi:TPA: cell wall-binding repeat-containing protein [Clostridium botulinum]|nr:cell wall-binding repeat-containing protein [Clostridium botulinum]HDK7177192.1 cell wall-binding repeat-containing protein [Clostridium botulinum]